MDLQGFLSTNFIFLSLGIAAITFVIRTIVDFFLELPSVPTSKNAKVWSKLILPILPVFIGVILGYTIPNFAYPAGFTSTSSRVIFSMVAGMFSGLVYQVINGLIKKELPAEAVAIINKVDGTATVPTEPSPEIQHSPEDQKLLDSVKDSITK
jgi:hypothetical protein